MLVIGLVACLGALAAAQSNYDSQGNSIEYSNEGLPDSTLLDGKVTKLDDISPVISLNRTKAALNCAAGFMQIELKFDEPFYGIAYADFDRASACQVAGKGTHTATIELPLKGCGTKQDPQRVFTNNIVVRFHPALEMEGDEVITIVCRYPPPVAPPPAGVPNFIKEEPLPASPLAPPLKGLQILLIICGILFLSLVLLGLGCSYYMLRRRRVQVVRRHPLSTGTGSEITKLSGSSLGHISLLGGLKIPRAHAPLPPSSSGSEALPSDYPSESPSSAHSELEDVETRRSLSSGGSYQNKAFLHDSYYSEQLLHEVVQVAHKRPPPEPKFDVQVRVKKAAPPPPSPTPPPSESEMSMKAAERNLTTILEREENLKTTFSYVPEIHPPPLYSTVMRKQPQVSRTTEESYTAEDTVDITLRRPSLATLNTEMTETRSMSEIVEKTATKYSPPPPLLPSSHYVAETETQIEAIEPPVVVSRRPEIKSHVVDDVFLRTITEKRTVEDVERHRRKVTETRKPPAPPAKWDVSIRNYPGPEVPAEDSATDWESYSETSSIAGPSPRRSELQLREVRRTETETERNYRSEPPPPLHNWEVLLRVLEPAETELPDDRSDVTSLVEQSLTAEDRRKWREIITTESTLRTMLTEATVREDYERIRRDRRYEKLFEPEKWDVIVRVLAPPAEERPQYDQRPGSGNNKYRRKADWDTRSRRSSLPTLYEYDSDGGSSVRTLTMETGGTRSQARSRRSSYRSDMDLRSMSEVTVDFGRERESLSEASSYYRYHPRRNLSAEEEDYAYEEERSLTRSLSQPSLARSGSEFTEQWGLRVPPLSSQASYSLSQSSYSRSQAQAWFADADSEASFK